MAIKNWYDLTMVDGDGITTTGTGGWTEMAAEIVANTAKVSYPGSADASELNILDGATITTTELNYVGGVTSAIQTQLDSKTGSVITRSYSGNIASNIRLIQIPIPAALNGKSVTEVLASLRGLPAGQDAKFDLRINGSASTDSMFTGDVPLNFSTTESATNSLYQVGCDDTSSTVGTAGTTLDSAKTTLASYDVLEVWCTQVGSTISGVDLTFSISVE